MNSNQTLQPVRGSAKSILLNTEPQRQVSPEKLLSAGLMIAGGLQMLLGLACFLTPAIAALATEILLGVIIVMVGITDLVFAWELRSLQGSLWRFLRAGCFLITGLTLLTWPLSGVVTLALVMGMLFLLDGSLRFVMSLSMQRNRGFAVLDGILGTVIGIMILVGWPSDSAFILGTVVGIRLMMGGLLAMMIGVGIHKLKT